MSIKTTELASRLMKLTNKRKELEDEIEEIRHQLADKMKEGEYIKVPCGSKVFRVMNEMVETRVLHDNQFIAKSIGKEGFLKIAKISITALSAVVGKEEIDKYIHRITTSYRIVVREDKENGKG